METTIIALTGLFGLTASFMTNNARLQGFLFALTGIALLQTARPGFEAADPKSLILVVLSVTIVIGLLAGLFLKKYSEWIALAGTLLSLLFIGKTVTYFGFEIEFNVKTALLTFMGGLVPVISRFKGYLINKWFRADAAAMANGVSVFLGGLLVFYAMFYAQYFGVFMIGAGWLSVALAKRFQGFIAPGTALLSLGFLFALLKSDPSIDTSFLRGNFLMGLVLGAGAISWITPARKLNRFNWLFTFVLPLLIIFAAVMLGKANPNFGGIPAYVGAVLGASMLLFTKRNASEAVPFQAMLIGLSLLILPQFAAKELPVKKSRIETSATPATATQQAPDPMAITAIALKPEMEGTWKSELESSKLLFKLGPEGGVTTGMIGKFDVTLKLNAQGEPEKIQVKMPSTSLTTFDPMRDESILGADYMNTAKFPTMGYVSSAIKKENDRYFVTGEFTMLGAKQPLNLELKFAANGMEKDKQYLVMVGKSTLDRTKFGMHSDSKIGNVVDVSFEIEFRK